MIAVGLMSGTSADGTDAAVVRLEGKPPALSWQVLAHVNAPHPPTLRAEIFACFHPETSDAARLCKLNFALGQAFAQAALQAIASAKLEPGQVDMIGSHGQTVWHIPTGPQASTLQIGEAAVIAEQTGITTLSNFRARDMAAGGQGAPLVAWVDALLFTHHSLVRAMQNIGGIANVTYLPPSSQGEICAFDTGPGNMLIDYAASRVTQDEWAFDRDGALAAQGRVDEPLLAELLQAPFLLQPPPKTTGRELFGAQFGAQVWKQALARGLSEQDIVATFTALTARSIAQAYRRFLPRLPDEVVISGGGARNPTLMQMLTASLSPARVITLDELGLSSEAKEAVAFAVLAYETWHNRPGNLPAATGARRPVALGNITPGENWARLATTTAQTYRIGKTVNKTIEETSILITELRNPATEQIDTLGTLEMVRLINAQDALVAQAIEQALPDIATAIDRIAGQMKQGGRLIYIGAGTSGRLGVLDAAECPPTFGTPPEMVMGVIAGGERALTNAVEAVEDDSELGQSDLAALQLNSRDCVVGIAASGRTPYVIGALSYARQHGALTISLACNAPSPMAAISDIAIAALVGPEAITGSTRLKAGTAQKMALNMISTGVMIRLGKTFGNLMVDVQATNDKLRARARRIVQAACGLTEEQATVLLNQCDGQVKTAIVVSLWECSPQKARQRLARAGGIVRAALQADPDQAKP